MIDILEVAGIVFKPPLHLDESLLSVYTDPNYHNTMIYQDSTIDLEWFKKQAVFIQNLTPRQQFILKTYTLNGDEIVNALMKIKDSEKLIVKLNEIVSRLKTLDVRGNPRVNIFDPVPLNSITNKNIIQIATKYANELFEIFKNTPPIEKDLRVFRGIKPEFGKDPDIRPLSGIISTTYSPNIAQNFAENYRFYSSKAYEKVKLQRESVGKEMVKNCCIFDIILKPGVKAIWVEPISNISGEQEIILLPTLIQASYSHPVIKTLFAPGLGAEFSNEFQTYDVVVTPIVGKTFSMKGGKTKRSKRRYRKTYRK